MSGLATGARRAAAALMVAVAVAAGCAGCTESSRVSHNVSKEADNFNVVRRITVFNIRTDRVLLQMTGTFALQNSAENELEVICELPGERYQKHYIYLNDWTTYIVEDLDESQVDKYSYELSFLPEMVPGVKITSED